jgi:hypothetical protein
MLRIASSLLAASLLAASAGAGTQELHGSASLPAYEVADRTAAEVTPANLLASERFWPYQAALVGSYTPAGAARAIPTGATGVVIRVERDTRVRIDFGRDGLVTLPVQATDLLRRANEIRTGSAAKTAPNLTYAITPRLLDGEAEVIRRVRLENSFALTGFLCLFADPNAVSFPKLAGLLAPFAGRGGVQPVLFAQGEHPDIALARKLNAAGWKGAFALDHMSEAYTRTLVDGALDAPTLALYSAEGRVIWSGPILGAIPPELEVAWAQAFPAQL